MNNRFYIYFHVEEDTGKVFYVGKGQGERAYSMHPRNPLWENVKTKHGCKVEIFMKNLEEDEAYAAEIVWISKLGRRDLGTGNLTNLTNGGNGWDTESATKCAISTNKKRTAEERSRTASLIWSKLSDEEKTAKAKLIWTNLEKKKRAQIAVDRWQQFTPEERSAIASKRWEEMEPEKRESHRESIKKSWENDGERKKAHAALLNRAKENLDPEKRSSLARAAVSSRYARADAQHDYPIVQSSPQGEIVRVWENLAQIRKHFPALVTRVRYCLEGKSSRANCHIWNKHEQLTTIR